MLALARWCIRYWRGVLLAWLVVILAGGFVGGRVFNTVASGGVASPAMESSRASALDLSASGSSSTVLVLIGGLTPRSSPVARSGPAPIVGTAIKAAAGRTIRVPGVVHVITPFGTWTRVGAVTRVVAPDPTVVATSIARNGSAVVLQIDLGASMSASAQDAAVAPIRAAFAPVAVTVPGARVQLSGTVPARSEMRRQTEADTRFGEVISLPLTLLVLLLVFGGILPSLVPFIGALASIAGAMVLLLGFSHLVDMDSVVLPVTSVLGLGLAVDYSLLIVNRYREERGAGFGVEGAIERTMLSAGRTVLFSGLLVASSLAGLVILESTIYRVVAAAAVSVVMLALAAALTLTPAILMGFGTRIRRPSRHRRAEAGIVLLVGAVQRRPVLTMVAVLLLFTGLAVPALGVRFDDGRVQSLPPSFETVQVAATLDRDFVGRSADPVMLIARTDPATLARWARPFASNPDVQEMGSARALSPQVSRLDLVPRGDGQGEQAQALVRAVRGTPAPFPVLVGGDAATLVDLLDEITTRGPWVLIWITFAGCVLMFLLTGSVVVPIKAMLLNGLSLAATAGVAVLIFQHGVGAGLIGLRTTGPLEVTLPMLVFVFAFGLSTDYECFIVGRIKELRDSGLSNDVAIRHGLQHSGRIVSCAAVLMCVVFIGFACGQMLSVKEIGVSLTVAVVLDATFVRLLLVPALLTAFGELNWWAPAPLRRLHRRFGFSDAMPAVGRAPAARAGGPGPSGLRLGVLTVGGRPGRSEGRPERSVGRPDLVGAAVGPVNGVRRRERR